MKKVPFDSLTAKVRSVQEQTHQHTTKGSGDRNCHDPRKDKQTNTLEVDGLECAVTETNADGGAGDAH